MFLDTSKFNSLPELTRSVNEFIIKTIKGKKIVFDEIVGAPYGGLPFSYGVATLLRAPCLSIRKEGPKNYSTAGEVLGIYGKGDRVLIIEDATVTGNTVIGFIKKLRKKHLLVSDVITIVDVGGPAKDNLKKQKVSLHALFTWKELYDGYKRKNPRLIGDKMRDYLDNLVRD